MYIMRAMTMQRKLIFRSILLFFLFSILWPGQIDIQAQDSNGVDTNKLFAEDAPSLAEVPYYLVLGPENYHRGQLTYQGFGNAYTEVEYKLWGRSQGLLQLDSDHPPFVNGFVRVLDPAGAEILLQNLQVSRSHCLWIDLVQVIKYDTRFRLYPVLEIFINDRVIHRVSRSSKMPRCFSLEPATISENRIHIRLHPVNASGHFWALRDLFVTYKPVLPAGRFSGERTPSLAK